MEYRFEGLVYPEKDARRHLAQSLEEFSLERAGDSGLEVLQRWIFQECRNWVQARRWCKDVTEGLYGPRWSVICKGAVQEVKQRLEQMKWRVEEIVAKGKKATAEEWEEVQETSAKIKDVEWNLEEGVRRLAFFDPRPVEEEYEAWCRDDIQAALTLRVPEDSAEGASRAQGASRVQASRVQA